MWEDLADGRRLAVGEWSQPDAAPTIYCHDSPGRWLADRLPNSAYVLWPLRGRYETLTLFHA